MLADLKKFMDEELLRPTLSRAFRATVAFMVPLFLAALGHLTATQAVLASFAGHAIAGLDIRGAYGLRVLLILALSALFGGAAWLGAEAAGSLALAVAATGLIALAAGLWRHVLGEYGFAVGASSALLFFIALSAGPAPGLGRTALWATLGGSLGGLALQAALWPFMAQHPLRRTVALSWTAVADLCAALPPSDALGAPRRHERVVDAEHALRTTLDQAFLALDTARTRRNRPFLKPLERLNHAAARLATQLMALDPTLERLARHPECAPLGVAARSALAALVNTTRSVALGVVSHQPEHLARFEVRLRRATRLLEVFQRRAATRLGDSPEGTHLVEVLRLTLAHLPAVRDALRASMERAKERGPISFELFDLEAYALRPLAAALNFTRHVDRALVRFSLRIAAMMMVGTALWRAWDLPHGYWIPLCVMVVLQPDYGATRQRATQRTLGTLAGSLTGSVLLWLHPHFGVLMAATALVVWAFTFQVKRRYGLAVFYITLLVVLQMESLGPVTLTLTLQRLGFTLAGCVLALLAALTFWPVWERERMPPLLAEALRANGNLLERLCRRLGEPGAAGLLQAKRQAERANSMVFSSLNRMAGDPKVRQEGLEDAAALANSNLRITRWLNAGAVHLQGDAPAIPGLAAFGGALETTLEALAVAVESGDLAPLAQAQTALDAATLPEPEEPRAAWVVAQLEQAGTELTAMLLQKLPEA